MRIDQRDSWENLTINYWLIITDEFVIFTMSFNGKKLLFQPFYFFLLTVTEMCRNPRIERFIINSWERGEANDCGGEEDSIEWMRESTYTAIKGQEEEPWWIMKSWRGKIKENIHLFSMWLCVNIMYPFGPDMITINIVVIIIITIKEWEERGHRRKE